LKTVLTRVFGPKKEEVVEGWRRLHNEELYNLYTSANIIRVTKTKRMRWQYKILVEKSEWERLLGETMHIEEDNIKLEFGDEGW